METMAHRARYAAAMTAITRRLPFGLSEVVEPNMLGYLLINLCTFCIDLGLLGLLHGKERLPIPIAVTISYGTASLISYILNRMFNFRSHAEVGRQLPVFVAVSASNYLIFVLGFTDLLSAVGVYYELARVIAACCEAVYLYCMMRWVVFRDVADAPDTADTGETETEAGTAGAAIREPAAESFSEPATGTAGGSAANPAAASPGGRADASSAGSAGSAAHEPGPAEPVFGPAAKPR
jgi:putative flippase GtrA